MLLSISPIELQIVERELIEIAFYIFVCLLFYFLFIRRARKDKALADEQNLEQDPLTDIIPHSGKPLLEERPRISRHSLRSVSTQKRES